MKLSANLVDYFCIPFFYIVPIFVYACLIYIGNKKKQLFVCYTCKYNIFFLL